MSPLGGCCCFSCGRFAERLRLNDRLRLPLVNDLRLSRQLLRECMVSPLVTCPGPASLEWLVSQYLNAYMKHICGMHYLECTW